MNSYPRYNQIYILLINILSLSLSLSLSPSIYLCLSLPLLFFSCKPAEVDKKFEELNLGHGRMLTGRRSSFPNFGV